MSRGERRCIGESMSHRGNDPYLVVRYACARVHAYDASPSFHPPRSSRIGLQLCHSVTYTIPRRNPDMTRPLRRPPAECPSYMGSAPSRLCRPWKSSATAQAAGCPLNQRQLATASLVVDCPSRKREEGAQLRSAHRPIGGSAGRAEAAGSRRSIAIGQMWGGPGTALGRGKKVAVGRTMGAVAVALDEGMRAMMILAPMEAEGTSRRSGTGPSFAYG